MSKSFPDVTPPKKTECSHLVGCRDRSAAASGLFCFSFISYIYFYQLGYDYTHSKITQNKNTLFTQITFVVMHNNQLQYWKKEMFQTFILKKCINIMWQLEKGWQTSLVLEVCFAASTNLKHKMSPYKSKARTLSPTLSQWWKIENENVEVWLSGLGENWV